LAVGLYNFLLEFVPFSQKTIIGSYMNMIQTLGEFLCPLYLLFVSQDLMAFQMLPLILTIVGGIAIYSYPESPQFDFKNKNFIRAEKTFNEIAEANGVKGKIYLGPYVEHKNKEDINFLEPENQCRHFLSFFSQK